MNRLLVTVEISPTPLRSAVIAIEGGLKGRPFADLSAQEQQEIQKAIKTILTTLGGPSSLKSDHLEVTQALDRIKAILDLADIEKRQLSGEEAVTIADTALALLFACQPDA